MEMNEMVTLQCSKQITLNKKNTDTQIRTKCFHVVATTIWFFFVLLVFFKNKRRLSTFTCTHKSEAKQNTRIQNYFGAESGHDVIWNYFDSFLADN